MSFWQGATTPAIYKSLVDMFATNAIEREAELERYSNYYDGRPQAILQYFRKRARETEARYRDRPKLSWPLCRSIVDVHAEALVKGFSLTFTGDDQATADAWAAISEHNDFDGSYVVKLARTSGKMGHCIARPIIRVQDDGEAHIEFDSYTPLEARLVYESFGAGRSVPHFYGVAITTGYSVENGDEFPWPVNEKLARELKVRQRVEYITPDRWVVWLDNTVTPVSPFGDVWMPRSDGTNPYGFVPVALINGLETDEAVTGLSDIHHGVYDVQVINEIWSDLRYAQQLCAPFGVLKTKNPNIQAQWTGGLGSGMAIGVEDDFYWATPEVNFQDMAVPLLMQLELTLANAHLPGIALGLERLYGSAARTQNIASGKAKELDWGPVISHAKAKRRPFTRGIKELVRAALRMAAFDGTVEIDGAQRRLGLANATINPTAEAVVEYSDEIIPLSKAEELERMTGEIVAGLRSIGSGMKRYHGWSDERVAQEIDTMQAEKKLGFVDMPYDQVARVVADRQGQGVDKGQAEKLFAAMPGFDSDRKSGGEDD